VRVQPVTFVLFVVEAPPDLTTIKGLVAKAISKMNAKASPGFDAVPVAFWEGSGPAPTLEWTRV